jgi:hypothetical protein
MTVFWCPVLCPLPFKGKSQHRNIALGEATEFFHVFLGWEHVFVSFDPFPIKIATFPLAGRGQRR